jgi:uridine kinase
MKRWAPEKRDTLDALAAEILSLYGRGRIMVAVDGVDAAGKTTFADDLAEALRRARGKDSPEGFYRDSYDYETFRRVLVDPFKDPVTESVVLAAFDHRRDAPVEPKWASVRDDTILLVDGIFLHRPELRGLWNYSIWLDVDPAIAEQRAILRDGPAGASERYSKGQALYLTEAKPRTAATTIIDNNDYDHPRRVYADSC